MPNYRISVPAAAIKGGGGGGDTTPPVESYDLGQKIRAALALGAFVTVGLTVLLWAGLFLVASFHPAPWQAWAFVPCLASVMGIIVACWQGYGWVTKAAIRAWEVDDIERQRRDKLEDAQMKAQQALANAARDQVVRGDDADGNPLTFTDQQRLDFVALNMLERIYLYDKPATRDIMTQDGACIQEEWNLVNQGMKAIGLRSRIGKGPCQGTFCSLRVASYLYDRRELSGNQGIDELRNFLRERWRGQQPLLWDMPLAQAELMEAMHCGLFGLELED